jgi:hypothetical protein
MAEKNSTTRTPDFELTRRLDKIEALGAALGNLEWEVPLEGKYLDDLGTMIRDLAIEAKTIFSEMPPPAVPKGGE